MELPKTAAASWPLFSGSLWSQSIHRDHDLWDCPQPSRASFRPGAGQAAKPVPRNSSWGWHRGRARLDADEQRRREGRREAEAFGIEAEGENLEADLAVA